MVQPSVIRLLEAFEAFATRADEDALIFRKLDHLRRQCDHMQHQNHLLLRLVRQLLEQTPDPAQVAALGEEIGKLEAASAQLTGAIEANPNPAKE